MYAELVRRKLLSSVTGAQNLASIDEAFAAEREGRSRRYKRDDDDDDDNDDKDDKEEKMCKPDPKTTTPARMCQTTFNTTAPMYGVSLTNGKPVTIVQKFPDLLQQVIFETCS